MNLLIEQMTLKDINSISDNFNIDFDDFWSISTLKNEIENSNSYYLLAKLDDTIVGFGGGIQILDEFELNYIVTKKDKRNLGIASKILYNLISFVNTKNIKHILLEVNENNTNAIKLYEKFEFKQIGFRKKYYNNKDNAILMQYENI